MMRLLLGVLCLLPSIAFAQARVASGFPVERLRITADRSGLIDVESGEVLPHLGWDFALHAGYARDPLVLYKLDTGERLGSLVEGRLGGAVTGGIGLFGWGQLSFELPYVIDQHGATDLQGVTTNPLPALRQTAVGDVRVLPKFGLLRSDRHGVNLAFLAAVTFPTGGGSEYLGDEQVTFVPELALSRAFGGLRLGANASANLFREERRVGNLLIGQELTTRGGVGFRFHEQDPGWLPLELAASVYSSTSLDRPYGDENQQSLEVRGQAAVHLVDRVVLFAGGGRGLLPGYGTPEWRAFGGLRVGSPPLVAAAARDRDGDGLHDGIDACPDAAETVNGVDDGDGCPERDSDGDGLLDERDACPTKPETKNGHQDEDGCPDDDDADRDGVRLPADRCPDAAEDVDGHEDADGCPDPDNDADGVPDTGDGCPLQAGPAENKGCPDADTDGDTVVDRLDNCPKDPGPPENQGCKARQLVVITADRLVIKDSIYFQTGKAVIQRRSYPLLDNVAQILADHPEIPLIRVEGHTDSQGNDTTNLRLSQARAESVVRYLVGKGIAVERLRAVGFGEARPIAPNVTRDGRAMNRRVEFNLGEETDGQPSTPEAP